MSNANSDSGESGFEKSPSEQNWRAEGPASDLQATDGTAGRLTLRLLLYGSIGLFCLFLLAALILPFICHEREGGRRMVCLNNIRNLGISLASYENSHRAYPGHRQALKIKQSVDLAGVTTDSVPVNWLVAILPNLERPDLYRKWENMTGADISTDGQVTYTFPENNSPLMPMELLNCPSDPRAQQPAGQGQPIGYIVNSGLQDVAATSKYPADWPANGVLISRWEMPPAPGVEPLMMATHNADDVSRGDGVSVTLLVSESTGSRNYDDVFLNVGGPGSLRQPVSEQWNCFVWQPEYPLPANLSQAKINGWPTNVVRPALMLAPDITYARPSSNHPGGANFVYCDAHAKFINENIDYLVFTMLMNSNGAEARMPGTETPVPEIFTADPLK